MSERARYRLILTGTPISQGIVECLSEQYGDDSVALFYGGIKQNDRSIEVEKFRTHARFMISTPSCGGVGQTWNEAHYVIFYNNGFKTACPTYRATE